MVVMMVSLVITVTRHAHQTVRTTSVTESQGCVESVHQGSMDHPAVAHALVTVRTVYVTSKMGIAVEDVTITCLGGTAPLSVVHGASGAPASIRMATATRDVLVPGMDWSVITCAVLNVWILCVISCLGGVAKAAWRVGSGRSVILVSLLI